MIKEIVQFTEIALADEAFRNLKLTPKKGLHIVLKVEKTDEQTIIKEDAEYAVYSGKTNQLTSLQKKCAVWSKLAWMVDTNKCLDLPVKAIHSASPFCFAVKKENLEGGEKFEANKEKGKSQVYDRIDAYFNKAIDLLDSNDEILIADTFRLALRDKNRLHRWIDNSGEYDKIKGGEYVIFYLDLPDDTYALANHKYLKEKLFNTTLYNVPDENDPEKIYGTSNWLNGFPSDKKPFVLHQSATFDISGRILFREAQLLNEFSDLCRRNLFSNPLPLFVMKDELSRAVIRIYREDERSGDDIRKGYLDIIEELWNDYRQDITNYYLLFMSRGEIKDFDFVSRFDYYLDPNEDPWKVKDLFGTGEELVLYTVKDLLFKVLPPMFNNALAVRRKNKPLILHWFDDMTPANCKTYNAYLMAMKYRKAFYDFIYKSKRQGVTGDSIIDIIMTGIKDDIRLDEYKNEHHSESFNIRYKLNLLFNLHQHFSTKPNPNFMESKIEELRSCIDAVAKGEAHIETDEQFAFAAGQVIARIFWESQTGDESFRYLEPFLAQYKPERFKLSICHMFKLYKHGIYSDRFRNVMSEVMTYEVEHDLRDLQPHILAGVFSKNLLFSEKIKDAEHPSEAI